MQKTQVPVGWPLIVVCCLSLFFPSVLVAQEVIDNPALFKALIDGDNETVKQLLDEGVDANAFMDPGAEYGAWEPLPLLVWGFWGGLETTRLLLEAGAVVNEPTFAPYGYAPWHFALLNVMNASVDVVRLLIDHGADFEAIPPALIVAMRENEYDKVRLLVEVGADVNVRNNDQRTPLLMALDDGQRAYPVVMGDETRVEITSLLLNAGADPNARQTPSSLTALMFAARNGYGRVVDILLRHGAEIDAVDGSWGRTALHWAADKGQLDAVKVLVEAGADVETEDTLGGTPLDAARRFRGRRADMEALVDYLTDAVAGR